MPGRSTLLACALLLTLLGFGILLSSGFLAALGAGSSNTRLTETQFLERVTAALLFVLGFLCYFFSKKP
jgi:hypothetical protein